jgi:hypothetical protein
VKSSQENATPNVANAQGQKKTAAASVLLMLPSTTVQVFVTVMSTGNQPIVLCTLAIAILNVTKPMDAMEQMPTIAMSVQIMPNLTQQEAVFVSKDGAVTTVAHIPENAICYVTAVMDQAQTTAMNV